MSEQSGPTLAAIRARQAALSDRYRTAAETDQALVRALQAVHHGAAAARERLDALGAEIDACVRDPDRFAADTPIGAREIHRFLLTRHRELVDVLTAAQHDAAEQRTLLRSLVAGYPV